MYDTYPSSKSKESKDLEQFTPIINLSTNTWCKYKIICICTITFPKLPLILLFVNRLKYDQLYAIFHILNNRNEVTLTGKMLLCLTFSFYELYVALKGKWTVNLIFLVNQAKWLISTVEERRYGKHVKNPMPSILM